MEKLSETQQKLLDKAKLSNGGFRLFLGSAGGWEGKYGWLQDTNVKFGLKTKNALVRKGTIERIVVGMPNIEIFRVTSEYREMI